MRLCYTGPSPDRERHLEIEARFGFEVMCGYAMSETPYGLVWLHGERPYGDARLAAPASRARSRQRRARDGRRPRGRGRRDRRARAAQPGDHARLLRDARRDGRGASSTAGCAPAISCATTATSTYTFIGRKKEVIRRRGENLSPAEVEAALAAPPRRRARPRSIGVPSDLSEDDVKAFVVAAPGRDDRPRRAARVRGRAARRASRCRATSRSSPSSRTPRPTGWRSTGCRSERTPAEVDFEARRARRGDGDR